MALIKCPECGREGVSSSAIACPDCGFGIREFYEKQTKEENNSQQIQADSEVAKIRAVLDEFYIREGARWYREGDVYFDKLLGFSAYMTTDDAIKCSNPGLGHYECIDYLEKAITDVYNKYHETTRDINIYNKFICGLFNVLHFEKYYSACLIWGYGSRMYIYNVIHVEILTRDTILEIVKQQSKKNYTVWSAGELNILFQGLNEADRNLCISYFGQKYNPQLTNNIDIEGLYQKWLEYKKQNKEFDSNLIDAFKGKRSTVHMPTLPITNVYDEPKTYQNQTYTYRTNSENKNIPKCPTCGSTNIKKISGLSKAGSVALWGLFSRKAHKQWHCNNCGSEW